MRKIVLLICDGMGDLPASKLGGKTPLQFAKTPHLDRMAAEGQTGILDVIAPGVTPGSDTAHLSLLGYDAEKMYTGRGPFEAAGAKLEIREGDVAFRCNFSTISPEKRVLDRRAGRIKKGTDELADAIDGLMIEDVQVIFREGTEHRAALVFRGPGLSADITDVDPHEIGKEILKSNPTSPEGEKTSRILNKFVQETIRILGEHPVNKARISEGKAPANAILPRGGGLVPNIPSLPERAKMKIAGVAGVTLVKGVFRACNIDIAEKPEWTGGIDTDIMSKAQGAVELLADHDLVVINIKATDLSGHDNVPQEKVGIIERIDKGAGWIMENMPEGTVFAVTADHSTPCEKGDHTGDPVPLVIHCKGNRADQTTSYDEITCSHGGLGRLCGKELLPVLMNMAGRTEKFGA